MSSYKIILVGVLRLYLLFLFLLLGGSCDGIVDVEPYVEPLHDVSVYLAKWIRPVSIPMMTTSYHTVACSTACHYLPHANIVPSFFILSCLPLS